jgi:hypothetical protein
LEILEGKGVNSIFGRGFGIGVFTSKSNNQDKRNENEDYFSDSRVHCNREALGFLL